MLVSKSSYFAKAAKLPAQPRNSPCEYVRCVGNASSSTSEEEIPYPGSREVGPSYVQEVLSSDAEEIPPPGRTQAVPRRELAVLSDGDSETPCLQP